MSKVQVVLHGDLLEAYGQEIFFEAHSYRSVLSGLKMIPQLHPQNNKNRYLSKVDGLDTVADLDKPLTTNIVHIYCEKTMNRRDIRGSGNNPYVQIVVGVILIVVGVLMMDYSGTTAKLGLALAAGGFSMIFGGIAQLLIKDPKPRSSEESQSSSLTGYENTVKSGTPIPLILGEHLHGGHIFSFNTETRSGKDLELRDFKAQFSLPDSPSWLLLYDGSSESDNIHTVPPGGKGGGGGGSPSNPHYDVQK